MSLDSLFNYVHDLTHCKSDDVARKIQFSERLRRIGQIWTKNGLKMGKFGLKMGKFGLKMSKCGLKMGKFRLNMRQKVTFLDTVTPPDICHDYDVN